jgi:hypothetical protein
MNATQREGNMNSEAKIIRRADDYATGHTPGVWSAIKPEGAPYWGIRTTAPECTIAGTASGLCERDALVAAAGPDMLAALQAAQEQVCSYCCPSTWRTADGPPPHSAVCNQIDAAVAKATGNTGPMIEGTEKT